jgi:SPX domain protein involved in polyphosphate accumulation
MGVLNENMCKGLAIIKKSKQQEWKDRLNILRETIEYWIHPENKTNKMVEIIQLFYDE